MSEVGARWARISEGFTNRLEQVPPGAWTDPSPCEDWSAHDVVKHVVDTTRGILTRLTGGDPTAPDSDEDLLAAWAVESAAVTAALADPARAEKPVQSMFGEQTFAELVGGALCADTLIHTWDLARATGQDDRLDAAAIEAAQAFLAPYGDAMRRPGGFGPAIEAAPDADPQTSFLAFVGRRA